MFIDTAVVTVRAGKGGNGVISFRHEKFIDRGGPDGGDGGNGGDVIFVASRNQNTLANFRFHKELEAESGRPGAKQKKHGKSGKDLIVQVPIGTVVITAEDNVVADLSHDGQQMVIAKGGKGGFGNAHFISSRRQAPRIAEKGEPGEEFTFKLELKSIADVGVVGLPNAGKSTLLSVLSNAKPEIANYPFTTLTPNLGVVSMNDASKLLFADVPGLIEGASKGKGLGIEFLRHVERTSVLLHLIDIYSDDIVRDYQTIQKELQEYEVNLADKPQVVALTKIDGYDAKEARNKQKKLEKSLPKGSIVYLVSSISGEGLTELITELQKQVEQQRQLNTQQQTVEDALPVLTVGDTENAWNVVQSEDGFVVTGSKIERFAQRTDFSSEQGVARLKDIMRKMGILHELERKGIEAGQTISIGKNRVVY